MRNDEARRCLLCKKPKCSLAGCPVHTPVPECVALYREDRLEEAGRLLFDNNPLSAITSQICDWKRFCHGHCVLNVKLIPVRWYELEQEVSAAYLKTVSLSRKAAPSGKRVAVVGSGPAGIAGAIKLYEAGFDPVVFSSDERLGGVLRYGIPPFRLAKDVLEEYERLFSEAGIEFRGGQRISSVKELASSYHAVLVATGAEKPVRLGIPGEDSPSVVGALEFLRNPADFNLGRKVIVIGGGNVAMDCCRTAVRLGVETWVYYRKTYENMPANPFEVMEAQHDGVRVEVFKAPVEVRPGGIVFRDCENVTDPDSGRVVTRIIDGTDSIVECDSIIPAISERPDFSILEGLEGTSDWGWPEAGEDGRLGSSNVFLAGDIILGPSTVVEAVAGAKKAVEGICLL